MRRSHWSTSAGAAIGFRLAVYLGAIAAGHGRAGELAALLASPQTGLPAPRSSAGRCCSRCARASWRSRSFTGRRPCSCRRGSCRASTSPRASRPRTAPSSRSRPCSPTPPRSTAARGARGPPPRQPRSATCPSPCSTDFRDAPDEHMAGDEALLDGPGRAIEAPQRKYDRRTAAASSCSTARGGGTRRRASGWAGSASAASSRSSTPRCAASRRFDTIVGPVERLRDVKYVIALDSDTQLPRDAARAARRHPGPPAEPSVYDAAARPGHRGLQHPAAAGRRHAGERGAARASRACSPATPGSIRTRARSRTSTRTCSTRVRSSARASTTSTPSAGASAIGFPRIASSATICSRAPTDAPGSSATWCCSRTTRRRTPRTSSRRSRWIRGDWQIAPWLLPRCRGAGDADRVRNPISRLSRWKILDNLRRSLVPVAMLGLAARRWALPGCGGGPHRWRSSRSSCCRAS